MAVSLLEAFAAYHAVKAGTSIFHLHMPFEGLVLAGSISVCRPLISYLACAVVVRCVLTQDGLHSALDRSNAVETVPGMGL